MSNPGNVLGVA